jgi:hypothetical protein
MVKGLFRPGAGSRIESFTAAFSSEVMYPGALVCINTLIPTSQGVSGVIEGKTLGVLDYIECQMAAGDVLGAEACMLGSVRGTSINSVANWADVSGDVFADGDLAIIQNYGVHPGIWITDAGTVGDYITLHATQEGEGVASSTLDTEGADVAVVLATGVAATFGDAQHNCIGWVRPG